MFTSRHGSLAEYRGLSFLSGFTRRDLITLDRVVERVEYESGEALAYQGSGMREWVLIVDGTATVLRNGRRVGLLSAGDHVGAVPMLTNRMAPETVVSRQHTHAYLLGPRDFGVLASTVPAFRRALAGIAATLDAVDLTLPVPAKARPATA